MDDINRLKKLNNFCLLTQLIKINVKLAWKFGAKYQNFLSEHEIVHSKYQRVVVNIQAAVREL